jgi:predicted kinase
MRGGVRRRAVPLVDVHGSKSGPSVIVITGVMAVGKSTIAQLVAERLPRAVHIGGDVFRRVIVSGRAEPTPQMTADARDQLRLRYRLAAMVADEYASAGFTAVVQDNVFGDDLPRFVENVRTRPRHVVVLLARPDVIAAREAARPKTGYVGWTFGELDHALREGTPRLGLWLDTSDQTPQQSVDELMARLSEAAID